jgi:hypothetical protein
MGLLRHNLCSTGSRWKALLYVVVTVTACGLGIKDKIYDESFQENFTTSL